MRSSTAPPRRYEEIVGHLEEAMLSGELAPGDRLPSERELMAAFGVGRGSVREALFALRKMGLVALSPGERAYVTRPDAKNLVRELSGAARQWLAAPDGVRHFQQARRMLECALAGEAAHHVTPRRLQHLRAALEDYETATALDRVISADIEFHFRIAEMAGNPVLTALHLALGEWLREQRATTVEETGAKHAAGKAHRRIYEAIAAKDSDAAARTMLAHLEEVEAFYWKHVAAETERPPRGTKLRLSR